MKRERRKQRVIRSTRVKAQLHGQFASCREEGNGGVEGGRREVCNTDSP